MSDINMGLVLQVLQIVSIVAGGIFVFATLRSTVKGLATDIIDIKADLKQFGAVLITQAVSTKRLDNLEEDMRDMKHGRGFVTPRSEGGLNGEYP